MAANRSHIDSYVVGRSRTRVDSGCGLHVLTLSIDR